MTTEIKGGSRVKWRGLGLNGGGGGGGSKNRLLMGTGYSVIYFVHLVPFKIRIGSITSKKENI